MPKLLVKDKELLRLLVKHFGYAVLRQRSSHVRITDGKHYATIPIHNRELRTGTLLAILKQVGLSREDIEKYL